MIEVLIPFYGDPSYLRIALESVLTQTTPPERISVLDDGYPDPTVGQWVSEYERVTYIRNESNLGANGNYRKALSLAEAEYVVFMGADDRMLPSFIERTVELAQLHGKPDIIQGGVRVIDDRGKPHHPAADRVKGWCRPRRLGPIEGEEAASSLLRGNWTYFPSLAWRRQTIEQIGFRAYDVVQDLALVIDTLRAGGRIVLDDEVTFEYRRHEASDSAVRAIDGRRFREERAYFTQLRTELDQQAWTHATRAARLHLTSRLHAASLVAPAVRTRNWAAARDVLRHAMT